MATSANKSNAATATDENKNNKLDWALFIIWTIIFFVLLIFVPQWFWVVIPFPLTYLVKAMNKM